MQRRHSSRSITEVNPEGIEAIATSSTIHASRMSSTLDLKIGISSVMPKNSNAATGIILDEPYSHGLLVKALHNDLAKITSILITLIRYWRRRGILL
jgi:hypothetical protein